MMTIEQIYRQWEQQGRRLRSIVRLIVESGVPTLYTGTLLVGRDAEGAPIVEACENVAGERDKQTWQELREQQARRYYADPQDGVAQVRCVEAVSANADLAAEVLREWFASHEYWATCDCAIEAAQQCEALVADYELDESHSVPVYLDRAGLPLRAVGISRHDDAYERAMQTVQERVEQGLPPYCIMCREECYDWIVCDKE